MFLRRAAQHARPSPPFPMPPFSETTGDPACANSSPWTQDRNSWGNYRYAWYLRKGGTAHPTRMTGLLFRTTLVYIKSKLRGEGLFDLRFSLDVCPRRGRRPSTTLFVCSK